jgi:nitrous oxidase accessory protein
VQQAVRAAAPGDTVLLVGAVYPETVTLDVRVALLSTSGSEIRGGYTGSVIHITAPGTTVDGIHVSETGTSLSKDMAAILVEADDVTIRNCSVTRPLHGIYVKGGNRARIEGNRIEGRLDLIESDRGNGIHLWNTRNNEVVGNEVVNVRDGIYFSFADSTRVTHNRVQGVRYGLHYMYSNYNTFVENVFDKNVAGAALMYSHDISFERNVFAHCRGFRAYGVLYQSMENTRAEGNLILDNSRGIFLNNSSGNTLADNDIVDNDLAIQLNGGCAGNRFSGNNFLGNLSDLILDVSDYDTAWQDGTGGNHWSAYQGFDLDRDGLGDSPHQIQRVFQIAETRVPEVRFLVFGAAAQILAEAERALPILNLGAALDSKPRVRAMANAGVPWQRIPGRGTVSSHLAAVAYLAGSLAFVGILLCWVRPMPKGNA